MKNQLTVILAIIMLSLLFACGQKQEAPEQMQNSEEMASKPGDITVIDPWVRLAPKGMNSGIFFSVVNGTNTNDSLLSVDSDAAELVEVHETYKMDNDMMGMRQVEFLPVNSGDTLTLQPGGYHVMLISLVNDLSVGDTVSAVLNFAHHTPVEITAISKQFKMKRKEMKMN